MDLAEFLQAHVSNGHIHFSEAKINGYRTTIVQGRKGWVVQYAGETYDIPYSRARGDGWHTVADEILRGCSPYKRRR